MRCFIAIELPENIKEFFARIVSLQLPLQGVNIVQKENFHITLKFLGEIEEKLIPEITQTLKNIACEVFPFTLKITHPGVFPDKYKPRVIWIGTEDTEIIKELAKKIDESMASLGFQREERDFKSHITMARVKNPKNGKYLFERITKHFSSQKGLYPLNFTVREFVLMKSTLTPKGSIYSILEKFPLVKCR